MKHFFVIVLACSLLAGCANREPDVFNDATADRAATDRAAAVSDAVTSLSAERGLTVVDSRPWEGPLPGAPGSVAQGIYVEEIEYATDSGEVVEFVVHNMMYSEEEFVSVCAKQLREGNTSIPSYLSAVLLTQVDGTVVVVAERRHEVKAELVYEFDSRKNEDCIDAYTPRGGGCALSLNRSDVENGHYSLGRGYEVNLANGRLYPVDVQRVGDNAGVPRFGVAHFVDVREIAFGHNEILLWRTVPTGGGYPGAMGVIYDVKITDADKMISRFPLQYASETQIRQVFAEHQVRGVFVGTVSFVHKPSHANMVQFEKVEYITPTYLLWPRDKGGFFREDRRAQASDGSGQQFVEGDRALFLCEPDRMLEDWIVVAVASLDEIDLVRELAKQDEDPFGYYGKILTDEVKASMLVDYKVDNIEVFDMTDDEQVYEALRARRDPSRRCVWVDGDGVIFHIGTYGGY